MTASRADLGEPKQHWLIWDGTCGFCRRSVVWFQQRDHERRFRVVPYQGCPSPPMTPALREASSRAIQVITADGRQVSGGRAVLFALREIGQRPALMRIATTPPLIWLVEAGYRVVARNRQFFSRLIFRTQPTDGPTC